MTQPYPLVFEPMLLEKVWGGDRLARLGKPVAPGARIGESWEIADLPATSPSGAGGAPARSRIALGPLRGSTLADAMRLWGSALMGDLRPTPEGGFPLLVKFLDARENLSVQVHPSAAYAAAHPGAHLKTECWYVLDADPGAVIYAGVRPGVGVADLARRAREGGPLHQDLIAIPAVAGECHLLPSGTCHALGAGVMVAEVQTPSDTTFRLYDWGRVGRALHVEAALECVALGPAPTPTRLAPGVRAGPLVHTEFFGVSECLPGGGLRLGAAAPRPGPVVLMVVAGRGGLGPGSATFEPLRLVAGMTVLVPASLAPGIELRAEGDPAEFRVLVVNPRTP